MSPAGTVQSPLPRENLDANMREEPTACLHAGDLKSAFPTLTAPPSFHFPSLEYFPPSLSRQGWEQWPGHRRKMEQILSVCLSSSAPWPCGFPIPPSRTTLRGKTHRHVTKGGRGGGSGEYFHFDLIFYHTWVVVLFLLLFPKSIYNTLHTKKLNCLHEKGRTTLCHNRFFLCLPTFTESRWFLLSYGIDSLILNFIKYGNNIFESPASCSNQSLRWPGPGTLTRRSRSQQPEAVPWALSPLCPFTQPPLCSLTWRISNSSQLNFY